MIIHRQQGYILLFSMVLTAIILSIIIGITTTALRQRIFTQQVKQSTISFYAADTALECLVAHDNRGDFGAVPLGTFPITVHQECSGDTGLGADSAKLYSGPNGSTVYEFDAPVNTPDNSGALIRITDLYCARGKVTKFEDMGPGVTGTIYRTTIDVWGYNMSCDLLDQHYNEIDQGIESSIDNYMVERSLSYIYDVEV